MFSYSSIRFFSPRVFTVTKDRNSYNGLTFCSILKSNIIFLIQQLLNQTMQVREIIRRHRRDLTVTYQTKEAIITLLKSQTQGFPFCTKPQGCWFVFGLSPNHMNDLRTALAFAYNNHDSSSTLIICSHHLAPCSSCECQRHRGRFTRGCEIRMVVPVDFLGSGFACYLAKSVMYWWVCVRVCVCWCVPVVWVSMENKYSVFNIVILDSISHHHPRLLKHYKTKNKNLTVLSLRLKTRHGMETV